MSTSLAMLVMFIAAEPTVEIPVHMTGSVRYTTADEMQVPNDHFDLRSDLRRWENIDQAEYRRRLDTYIEEAYQCENPKKLSWFLQLAHASQRVDDIHGKLEPLVVSLIIDQPRCFLRAAGLADFGTTASSLFRQYVFDVAPEERERRENSLSNVLGSQEFTDIAKTYGSTRQSVEAAFARERERERRRQELAAREYRQALKQGEFLENSPREYWSRWEEITRKARDCEDIDALADIFDAAILHVDDRIARLANAEFIEPLVVERPDCVLAAMAEQRREHDFTKYYLFEPLFHSAAAMYGPLAYVSVDGDALKEQQRLENRYEEFQRRRDASTPQPDRFFWSFKIPEEDKQGGIHVSARTWGGVNQERVESLWNELPPSELESHYGLEIRRLPMPELGFITQGRSGHYLLLSFGQESVSMTKARAVKGSIMEWYCGAPVALLELESEEPVSGDIAIELRDDLPIPEASNVSTDDRQFTTGRLTWPGTGRSLDFHYSSAYVGIHFDATDNQTGRKHYAERAGQDCH